MDRADDEGLMLDLTRAISPVLEGRDRDTVITSVTTLAVSVIMYANQCSRPEALKTLADLVTARA